MRLTDIATVRAEIPRQVSGAFATLPTVLAVAEAGSGRAGAGDEHSDVDLYVYATEPIPLWVREEIAARFATHREIGNAFWEPGDEWVDDRSGIAVDVMYRTPAWIEEQLDRVLVRHEASTGYSTCFWHNVLHSVALFDRAGWYRELQERASVPYPDPLRQAIIAKNYPVLRQSRSSYRDQIELAIARNDRVSVQHRITALLASYFDILFAVNRLPHPGEKRLLQIVAARCPKVPPDLDRHVHALLAAPPPEVFNTVDTLIDGLDDLLVMEGLPLRAFTELNQVGD